MGKIIISLCSSSAITFTLSYLSAKHSNPKDKNNTHKGADRRGKNIYLGLYTVLNFIMISALIYLIIEGIGTVKQ